jgi:subtilisin family serine protease
MKETMNSFLPDYFINEVFDEPPKDTIDWGLNFITVQKAWAKTKGQGIKVAVLDTGCQLDHPDLSGQIIDSADFTGDGVDDKNSHGTHVSGIIAAREDGQGIVGVAPKCKLLIGKVLNNSGAGASTWIARGVRWAYQKGAHIISMSLGSSSYSREIHDAIKEAVANNVIVVAAAGNSGPGTINYPGAHPEVVCVGAVDAAGRIANFSSQNKEVDVAAPGVNILSTIPRNRWAKMSGTSMATPLVAGVAALVQSWRLEQNLGLLKPADFQDLLRKSSVDFGTIGKDPAFGWGLVDPALLVFSNDELPPRLQK